MISFSDFGVLFFLASILIVLVRSSWLIPWFFFSSSLQASSVFTISLDQGCFGVPAHLISVLFLAVHFFCLFFFVDGFKNIFFSWLRLPSVSIKVFYFYVFFSIVSSFLSPILFRGLPVYSLMNINGFDANRVGLFFSLSNFAQAVNIFVHSFSLLYCSFIYRYLNISPRSLFFGFFSGVILASFLGFYGRLATWFDLPSIVEFWMNNPGYSLHHRSVVAGFDRFMAPFSESSYASAFIGSFLVAFFSVLIFKSRSFFTGAFFLFIVLLGLINTISTTGWLVCFLGFFFITILGVWFSFAKVSSPLLRRKVKVLIFLWVLFLGGGLWLWHFSPMKSQADRVVQEVVLKKFDSDSAKSRHRSNLNAWDLTKETRGLGVGLGSNRASSYFMSLLSNVGVIGTLAFYSMLACILLRYRDLTSLTEIQIFAPVGLVASTLAVCLSIPDLNWPGYWVFIILAFVVAPSKRNNELEENFALF